MMKALLAGCVICLGAATAAAESEWRLDIEANASLAVFGGVGGNVGWKPSATRQLRVHAGAFTLELPQFGLGENRDQGWTVRDTALLTGGRYYLRPARGGFYAGLTGLYQRRRFEKTDQSGSTAVGHYVVAAEVGFEWFPSKRIDLYVSPNINFAVRVAETGEPMLGSAKFEEKSYLFLPGLNVGWEF